MGWNRNHNRPPPSSMQQRYAHSAKRLYKYIDIKISIPKQVILSPFLVTPSFFTSVRLGLAKPLFEAS
jgi:hypothetical protein